MALLMGYDVGSSSVKASLLDAETGALVGSATSPDRELEIKSPQPGWAEQDPETWWHHICAATGMIRDKTGFDSEDIKGIGISYQMHGLVMVDGDQNVLRPAIIWCDSRAVGQGDATASEIGEDRCLEHMLNLPGNFTASKLKWVKENEPEVYGKTFKFMLPGDYVAMKMTGAVTTTVSGLSEGIMWDYKEEKPADFLFDANGFSMDLVPELVSTFGVQGELSDAAAGELGLRAGAPVAYRAGDQPNNALSLNVLEPGEVAVTAGTSGVVYGVSDQRQYDPPSRVNIFAHVNHVHGKERLGVLLCVNGTGILNSWLKRYIADPGMDYKEMDQLAGQVPVGSDGLVILPYGNGAERTLGNRDIGASIHGLNFNRHDRAHCFRAGQEGIVYSLNYGLEIMRSIGLSVSTVRAGHANMFLSPLFAEAFATVTGATVELFNTDGSQGAARGAGIGVGLYDFKGAFKGLEPLRRIDPNGDLSNAYAEAYSKWRRVAEAECSRQ